MMAIAIAVATLLLAQTEASAADSITPKLYKADKELGAFLDKALLAHRKEIVFYTKDRSVFETYSPTLETKLDYCSVMLCGIKHDRIIHVEPVVDSIVEVEVATDEDDEQQVVVTRKLAYYKITIKPKYKYSKAKDRKFYNKIQRVAKKAKKKKSVRSRARYINNYIAKNVSYSLKSAQSRTAYAALMKGKASCQGYSDLFTLIARQSGLKAETVCGFAWIVRKGRKSAREYHSWNIVKNGKKWVQIDTTFNDTGRGSRSTYFMKTKKAFKKNHKLDNFYKNAKWKKEHPLK